MRSSFMGLETARRGMFTQQSALYTTGHNISNANTPGFSRQRINFTESNPFPAAGFNKPMIPGQMGTGVEAGSIQRIRDDFLDLRYRGQNSKLGYFGTKSDALARMEDIMNEPTKEGLSSAMDAFWNSLQTLGTYPNESGARESVLAQANSLADTFNYLSGSLESIRSDLAQSIDVSVAEINSIAEQINKINKDISKVEPHGDLPNDLYDKRDRLIDDLSKLVNIKVTKQPNGGLAKPIAEGTYKIEIVNDAGVSLGTLVDNTTTEGDPNLVTHKMTGGYLEYLKVGNNDPVNAEDFAAGSLKADIESNGYIDGNGDKVGEYPQMIDELDKLAFAFVKEFNIIHANGDDLNGNNGVNFFTDLSDYKDAANKMSVAITDPNQIAAAADGTKGGNGKNAYDLSDVMRKDFSDFVALIPDPAGSGADINLKDYIQNDLKMSGNIKSFYGGVITGLGVQAREANVLASNTETLIQSVEFQRQSVSGVSLDEEMTNLIKFQHAYNASARNITVIDEMLDKIINGMGTVGR
ncbi:flagellar hook-associated protein FlgK [Bacillus canaveralius]|uniref:Flagellar hook-associated protein 1 n=1 Tax=Bacillus canaveralius TaxID=1403243 RepID=A0A2N5GMJ1_9BACI|nr:flagellar hook-associated protein FlgK [Bacillus canaveralius]PLR83157.1 flagellar hook-associated protein FlgK [Bacillus canaveralius]PLR94075.1 flagellar hook-associated protein FlgK [Bacillus canaveralius]RSK54124.1 flagellar hook-associated protein FlgK [Bacillus canaveralius]